VVLTIPAREHATIGSAGGLDPADRILGRAVVPEVPAAVVAPAGGHAAWDGEEEEGCWLHVDEQGICGSVQYLVLG